MSLLTTPQGPGWLLFFGLNAGGGGGPPGVPAPPAPPTRRLTTPQLKRSDMLREQELALEENDIMDLVVLIMLSGIIE